MIKVQYPKKELERLSSVLAHCSHVVGGGRTHFRIIYDLYKVILKNNPFTVKLGKAAKQDLRCWANLFTRRSMASGTLNMSSPWYLTLPLRVLQYIKVKKGLRVHWKMN